jgi:hypothetical protein
MAGFIKGVTVEKVETKALNTKVNKEVFDNFKIRCLELRYPMNVVLEVFMQQYANGRFNMDADDIIKWKKDDSDVDTLNTTFNKKIYFDFKSACKGNGYFVRHIITAFMEKFANGNLALEYVEIAEVNKE